MFWNDKAEKNQKNKTSKASPTDVARLATYARTRAVQENEVLGHHYWEMHKETDTNLWQINRVELVEEVDEDNPAQSDVFRTVKAQYYHLNFFDAIKQMADFENYLTVSTAKYINETTEELGDQHYIHVAEQEGFIVFDAKSKRPVYAPNGKIPENGKFRESDLQRAFKLAAITKEKHPDAFKQENTDISNVSRANLKAGVPVQPMAVPSGIDILSDMIRVAYVSDDNKAVFEQIKEMDELITDLKICREYINKGIKKPYEQLVRSPISENYLRPFEYVREVYDEIKSKAKSIKCADSELKQSVMGFFQKMEISIHVVEAQSWHEYSKKNPEFVKKYRRNAEASLKKAIGVSKKIGITGMALAPLQLTIGEESPRVPEPMENFIKSYDSWRESQLKSVKDNRSVPKKMVVPLIK